MRRTPGMLEAIHDIEEEKKRKKEKKKKKSVKGQKCK
jgi:hypothetical protein